jgi:dipeptidyl aminopeptidase/acylaminoacyl peptidase
MKILNFALLAIFLLAQALPGKPPQYSFEQYLNIRTAWGGQFTPDGHSAVFLSDITGVPQAYMIEARGGWPLQLTFFGDGISGAALSRDGKRILIAADAGGSERDQFYLTNPNGESPRRLTFNDKAIFSFGGWSWDNNRFAYTSNVRDKGFFDLYLFDLQTDSARLLLQKNAQLSSYGWSPDDRWLVVSDDESSYNNNLYLVNAITGEARLLTSHQGQAVYLGAVWTPDNRGFYLISDEGREFQGLAYYNIVENRLDWIETPPWDLEGVTLSRDGSLLAWMVNNDGHCEFHLKDLTHNRELPPPPLPSGMISGFSFSCDNTRLIFNFNNATHNTDVWVYYLYTGELLRLTQSTLAGIDPGTLVAPQLVHYRSFDNLMIPGFLYLPLGASQGDSLAVVVKLHGGPESQALPYLSGTTQYFLNRGLAVFEPNVRGSTGYGRAYTHLDDGRKRLDSVKDMEYAAKWLIEQRYAHPRKLAVFGGSYGGYMALAALTEQPDLWAAGVDLVGISNWVTFLENTGAWRRANREAEYGSLAHDRDFLASISPIRKVDRIKAPLLVIQGANDPRVPREESEQIVKALKKRKQTVEYLLYLDEGHGVSKLSNKLDCYPKMADFLLRYLDVK